MNKFVVSKLINNAGFSHTYEADRLQLLVQLTLEECIKQLNSLQYSQTVNNQNHSNQWHDGVDSSIQALTEYFEVNK
jgi:hypothetical protein